MTAVRAWFMSLPDLTRVLWLLAAYYLGVYLLARALIA